MVAILLVEDEPMIALDLREKLAEFGFSPIWMARSVEEALAQITVGGIRCAIVDYKLHDQTAEPVLERLRIEKIPHLLLTGYDREVVAGKAANAPVLVKPFVPARLARALVDLGIRLPG